MLLNWHCQAKKNAERSLRDTLSDHLTARGVPNVLQQRIHSFYDFVGGISRARETPLPLLPSQLRLELDLYTMRDIFLKVPRTTPHHTV